MAPSRSSGFIRDQPRLYQAARGVARFVRRVRYFGFRYQCPVCSSRLRKLLPNVVNFRPNVICPICKSHVRHRAAWPYMLRFTNLLDGKPKRLLHFAPEVEFARRLRAIKGIEYLSTDFRAGAAMVQADIRCLHFPDNAFDIVLCSHVLEHIDEDRRAMRELVRIVRPGGWVLIQVPLSQKPTDEDPAVTDPEERERRFLQNDHLRLYGPDLADRLREAGFTVQAIQAREFLSPLVLQRTLTNPLETIFFCTKAGKQ